MRIDVRTPSLSDSVASGTLLAWRRQVGDVIARDDVLVDLETDKVILEIPAPASGTLVEITRMEGDSVTADEVIAVIETGEGAAATAKAAERSGVHDGGTAATAAVAPPATPGTGSPPRPSRHPDAAEQPAAAPPAAAAPSFVQPIPEAEADMMPTPARREPMSRLRRRVAERLVAAQHTAAMLTTFNEANMAPVNAMRQRYKADFEVRHGARLGYMSFFVRAVCAALRQFPVVNAAIDGSDVVWHDDVDIGIAVSTPRGLVVPVLRRAQTLTSAQIELAIADFGRRARDGRLTLEELAGGTFSITNGGVFGSLLSTPILNPPQSAILGMHAIQERPVAEHGQVVIRPMMYLALTYDHRLVDGRDAVQFLVAVKRVLEAPETLLEDV
jgi:2-oxoglutarate dehydrogenase E2 component (dihydrolipoamide succinyltransferase)